MANSPRVAGRRSIHSLDKSITQNISDIVTGEESEKDDDTVSHSSRNEEDELVSQEDDSDDINKSETASPIDRPKYELIVPESSNYAQNHDIEPESNKIPNIYINGKNIEILTDILNTSINTGRREVRSSTVNCDSCKMSSNAFIYISLISFVVVIGALALGSNNMELATNQCDGKYSAVIDSDSAVWSSLISGVKLVIHRKRPSVFLYLYKDLPEAYIDALVQNLSEYASCSLKANDSPIELTKAELTSSRAKSNYGYIIDEYRNKLFNKKVMVVKHLEQVPGVVAQVFHTFCDEVTPLVGESLFIFTMKVDDFGYDGAGSDSKLVHDVLWKKWWELHEDVFDPLLTRLSNMIVRIETTV